MPVKCQKWNCLKVRLRESEEWLSLGLPTERRRHKMNCTVAWAVKQRQIEKATDKAVVKLKPSASSDWASSCAHSHDWSNNLFSSESKSRPYWNYREKPNTVEPRLGLANFFAFYHCWSLCVWLWTQIMRAVSKLSECESFSWMIKKIQLNDHSSWTSLECNHELHSVTSRGAFFVIRVLSRSSLFMPWCNCEFPVNSPWKLRRTETWVGSSPSPVPKPNLLIKRMKTHEGQLLARDVFSREPLEPSACFRFLFICPT